jgi:hypothetical protein
MKSIIPPIVPQSKGEEVANLQECLLFLIKKAVIDISKEAMKLNRPGAKRLLALNKQFLEERKESTYGKATTAIVRIFQVQQKLGDQPNGIVEDATAKKLNQILIELKAFTEKPGEDDETGNDSLYNVRGTISDNRGAPLSGYVAELFIVTIGSGTSAGRAITGKNGEYNIYYKVAGNKPDPDIEVRVYEKRGRKVIGTSAVHFNASPNETLDIIVSGDKIKKDTEFGMVLNEIKPHLGRLKLSELKEDENNQNITYLSNKTGWDARIVAMLVSSAKLGNHLKIESSHLYALLRAGVPGTEEAIKTVSSGVAEAAIKEAVEKNIIPSTVNISETLRTLESLSVNYILNEKPPSSISSMSESLDIRGLDKEQKTIFAKIQKQFGNDSAKLWSSLSERGFDDNTIASLKLDGKLGYLTSQNVPLIRKVYEKFNIKTDADLVTNGLYKSSEWKKLIGDVLPQGATAEEYARHLAFQVKIGYPTAVVGEMIKREEIRFGDNAPIEELNQFFISNHTKKMIGSDPVKSWDGFNQLSTPAKVSAKIMERIYQMSPSDESMIALSKSGLYSAYQIAAYTKNEFLQTHGESFPGRDEAEMVYNKAIDINNASVGIATGYITARTMPDVYAITGKSENAHNETIAYPTLEELLGNMDYCSCDHCNSVLSPAAYLVELLNFIDLGVIPHEKENPIDALLKRRPDIQHIQLSCENTNMSLPYIDLVNEILEHYIIHGNLQDLAGHDISSDITQAALLAEPHFVEKTVYDELNSRVFPYNLPFHQPLETLRRIFKIWNISLEEMLSIFSTPLSSRMEALSMSEREYQALTDVTYKQLPEYFGEAAGSSIAQLNAAVANGKAFCHRTGISYNDLTVLLKTSFINPGSRIIPLFQKLRVSLTDLNQFYNGTLSGETLDSMIPVGISPDEYEGDIKQWLTRHRDLIMGLITLTDTVSDSVECDFSKVELRYALPDNATNQLTELAYHKFHRFVRLLHKTGWSISTLDSVISTLGSVPLETIAIDNIDLFFVTLINRIANFKKIADHLSYSERKFPELLLVLNRANLQEVCMRQCAKITKLSLPELAELIAITGIDPLADDMEADEPSLMNFILTAQQLKAHSLKVADLSYILHHVDLTSKLTVDSKAQLRNVKILRETLNNVEKENHIAPDNADYDFAKSKMLLVYDAGVTDYFFGLLLGTNTYGGSFVTGEESLPDKITNADSRLGFDPFKMELTYTGILSGAARDQLKNRADTLVLADMEIIASQPELDAYISDFKTVVDQLCVTSNAALIRFGASYPELKNIHDLVVAEPTPALQTKRLTGMILPELTARLKSNGLKQALISVLKSNSDTVNVLTAKKENIRSAADATESVMYDFLQLENVPVFNENKTYNFYIDVPATDEYLLYVSAEQNTVVSLMIDEQPLISNITMGNAKEIKNAFPVSLKTGELHKVAMTIASLPATETVQLSWRTKALEKSVIPAMAISSEENVDFARESLTRLSKASQLQQLLGLTPDELDYFASVNEETSDLLNELDTDGSITSAELKAIWGKIRLLVLFKQMKEENEPEDNTWLQVLQTPDIKNNQNQLLLEYFNLWNEADLTAVLQHFGLPRGDLSKLSLLQKVADAMALLRNIHYPATDVLTWITNNPSYDLVAWIKAMIKQKVTEAIWLETMQTVSDPVRNLLRNALVSYVLEYKKPSPEITTPDKLYEYFLIDVEMDACMKTSRIRMALSTLQLFIQRCMMNLEPNVSPDSIRAERWAWMKRYRLWEANRKVFLYPENWLEPELRDNKSTLFKELEGELLQAEVTDESAELGFLNYLKKLDDIAKLEIVGMYLEENEQGNQFDDILHVIGRTGGNTRQYYYRRFEYGYWTPWEKINLNIEGNHIFPIIWRKRLFLFWLNILEKPVEKNSDLTPQDLSKVSWGAQKEINVEISMCWGEYFKGKWTSPKSTELKRPVIITNIKSFDSRTLLLYGRKEMINNPAGKIRECLDFYLIYKYGKSINRVLFTSKNALPSISGLDALININQLVESENRTFMESYVSRNTQDYFTQMLIQSRIFKAKVKQPASASVGYVTEDIFTKKKDLLQPGLCITPLRHPTENQFEAPLYYADEQSTFFVQPDEEVYRRLPEFDFYFPWIELPPLEINIPELVDKPIPGWPPVMDDLNRFDEIVNLSDPWNQVTEKVDFNQNYNKILLDSQPYLFEGSVINTTGKVSKVINK